MMLVIHEITGAGQRAEIGRADDVYAAVDMLPGHIVMIEEDADHPDHYDAMIRQGGALRQFTIEPVSHDA